MNKIFVFLLIIFFNAPCFSFIDNEPFQEHLCQNGHAGTWVNACSCYQGFSGTYCDEKGISCLEKTEKMYSNKGLCYKAITYEPIVYQNKTFYISRSLMNFDDAQGFCKSLGTRAVTRKDLNCNGEGVGCVDTAPLILFQEKTYNRGFVWLDKHSNLEEAYYMDINDGVVYHADYKSAAVTQALCIKDN